jgi:hypothetical protein
VAHHGRRSTGGSGAERSGAGERDLDTTRLRIGVPAVAEGTAQLQEACIKQSQPSRFIQIYCVVINSKILFMVLYNHQI